MTWQRKKQSEKTGENKMPKKKETETHLRYYSMPEKVGGGIVGDKGRAMSMAMRSVCVNMHMTLMHLTTGLLHRQSFTEMQSLIITGGEGVDHHGSHSRKHGHEAGEREMSPGVFTEAWTRQALESIRQNMDKSGGENHAGSKGLDHEKDILFGTQSWDFLAQGWERDSHCAGCQYGTYSY